MIYPAVDPKEVDTDAIDPELLECIAFIKFVNLVNEIW